MWNKEDKTGYRVGIVDGKNLLLIPVGQRYVEQEARCNGEHVSRLVGPEKTQQAAG